MDDHANSLTPSNAYILSLLSVTNECNRKYCPLANSQYGTVQQWDGNILLKLKTVERAHLPSRLWDTIGKDKHITPIFPKLRTSLSLIPSI